MYMEGRYVIVVPWLLKCVGFVPPKGYHVLPRAQSEEVYDKPEGGAIPHTSKAMVQLTCTIAVCKRLPSACAVHGICTT